MFQIQNSALHENQNVNQNTNFGFKMSYSAFKIASKLLYV